jgi:hypothetical protein
MDFTILRDTEKSMDIFLDNDKMNLSFLSDLDSDVDTDDEDLTSELITLL